MCTALFLFKVLEKAVLKQLTAYLDKRGLISWFQSGFRRCHSTEAALEKILNGVRSSNDCGKVTALVLLDLSGALDRHLVFPSLN